MSIMYPLGEQDIVKDMVGSKAFNLDILLKAGVRVPQAFAVSTEACNLYNQKMTLPDSFQGELLQQVLKLEQKTGKKLGGLENPLLLSVRSGAVVSMPGMMDTILNLGLNIEVTEALAKKNIRPKFAYNCYLRFIKMFSEIAGNVPKEIIDKQVDQFTQKLKIEDIQKATPEDIKTLCSLLKLEYKKYTSQEFPDNPIKQLEMAIVAVFESWNNKRAIAYRNYYGISHKLGTGVVVQEMVFGNMGQNSATGVTFTRNPNTGENILFGEYLRNAQGEDVVDGSSTPHDISQLKLESEQLYQELLDTGKKLEDQFKDMQDIEFTVEDGKLYILQTRTGKRTVKSAIKIAYDLFQNGTITEKEMLMRIKPEELPQLLHPVISKKSKLQEIGKGLGVSFGACKGVVALSVEKAIELANNKQSVILVRPETTAEDIEGMHVSKGLLTKFGGMTSHAAVVARSLGKTCVCSANFDINFETNSIIFASGTTIQEGSEITIDGENGKIYVGKVVLEEPNGSPEIDFFLDLIDQYSPGRVKVNADSRTEVIKGLSFGAKGVGLCRTEHMLLEPKKLNLFQKFILTEDQQYLEQMMLLLKRDFVEILQELDAKECLIRLLDPPLHEFLPNNLGGIEQLAKQLQIEESLVVQKVKDLKEHNPMLGFRGSRLGIIKPEIYEMLMKTIIEATCAVNKQGKKPIVQIQAPFIFSLNEFINLKKLYQKTLFDFKDILDSKCEFGAMLETPRSCLLAHEIATEADFLSFGSNDLTQMTFGISRDDSANFLHAYQNLGIINKNPFVEIDTKGVLRLMQIAVDNARGANPNIKIGICGEQAADPTTAMICLNELKLDYLSISAYSVLTGVLADTQASLTQ